MSAINITSQNKYRPVLAFSPLGTILAVAAVDKSVHILDTKTCSVIAQLRGHTRKISALAFSQNGKILISGANSGKMLLWNMHNYSLINSITHLQASILRLCSAPNSSTFASAAADNTLTVWDAKSFNAQLTITLPHPIINLSYSPDSRLLTAVLKDGTIKIWNTESFAGSNGYVIEKLTTDRFSIPAASNCDPDDDDGGPTCVPNAEYCHPDMCYPDGYVN